jgi:putative hydrolase of the HAD superfamily
MPASLPNPEAVLFDLDGTLVDRAAGLSRYAELFAEDFRDRLPGACTVEVVRSHILAADDFGSMAQAERLSGVLPWSAPTGAARLHAHWKERFGAACTPFGDVAEVIAALQARGVRLGLVTNGGSAMQRSKIKALGLEPALSVIAISSELGLEKPDPAIFRHALAALDCSTERAWFVGDHPELDVRGAVSAGLIGFWVRTGVAIEADPPPGIVLHRLADLLGYLAD